MLDKLAAVEARYSQIEARLAAPETYDDPAQVARGLVSFSIKNLLVENKMQNRGKCQISDTCS